MSAKLGPTSRIILVLTVLIGTVLPVSAQAVYNMFTTDGYQCTKVVDGSLLFYDAGGPEGKTKTGVTGYTLFKAKTAGDQLTLRFSAPARFTSAATHLYIYEGDCRYANGATGDPVAWKQPVPAGYVADITNGQQPDSLTFSSGVCSVLYYSPDYYEQGEGWQAMFGTLPGMDMTLDGVEALQDFDSIVFPSRRDIPLMTVRVRTTGAKNPLRLSRLTFDLTSCSNPADLTRVRCLSSGGSRNTGSATQLRLVSSDNGRLVFEGDIQLQGGDNYFTLLTDISDLASPGNIVDAALASAVINDTERVSRNIAPAATYTLQNILYMEPGNHTYLVGDFPRNFYDDGGPDHPYTKWFDGTATFIPSKPGALVRIDLRKLNLHTSDQAIATGRNDVIRIYDGTSANPDSLLEEIVTNTPMVVSSTTGALTMTFTSVYYIPTAGFEAVVSQFLPAPMRITSVSAATAGAEGVNAGKKRAPIMQVMVRTSDCNPPTGLTTFRAKVQGDVSIVDNALLSYFGHDKELVGEIRLANALPDADGNLVFAVPSTHRMLEGDNYYLVSFDVSEKALKEEKLGASFVSLSTADTTVQSDTSAPFMHRVENICRAAAGWDEVRVYDSWEYQSGDTPTSGYPGTMGNRTVTFRPVTPGAKVELQLDKFLLTWPTVSSIVGPQFTIYDGASHETDTLWSLTADNREQWPREPLRATNADGALTVVFNPMGTTGRYGAGFHADVYEQRPGDRTVSAVKAFTPTTEPMAPGAKNQPLLGIEITTEGDSGTPQLRSVDIALKGAGNIDSLKIYTTANSSDFNAERRLAGAVTGAQSCVPVSLSLNAARTYLWVACDVKADATVGDTIDVALTGLDATCQLPGFTTPDPDGARVIMPIVLFAGSGQVVDVAGPVAFYDNGGPEGNYTSAAQGTVTFRPTQGKAVRFTFRSFELNPNDSFYIYDGAGAVGQYSHLLWGSRPDQVPIVSASSDGALTVRFSPTRSDEGWSIIVEPVDPSPLRCLQVTARNECKLPLHRGSTDNLLMSLEVETEGSAGRLVLSDMQLTAPYNDESAVASVRLLTSGNSDKFTDARLVATAPTLEAVKDMEADITSPGTIHLWIVADIADTARIGSYLHTALTALKANGEAVPVCRDGEGRLPIGRGMSGTYRLGASAKADFHGFAKLNKELCRQGIDGDVAIEVEAGTYTDQVLLGSIPGASRGNRLIVRPAAGAEDEVVFRCNSLRQRTDTLSAGMLLHRARGIVLQGLRFESGDSETAAMLALDSAADVTVENCRFTGAPTCAVQVRNSLSSIVIQNNFMRLSAQTELTGILAEGSDTLRIYNNEVRMGGNGCLTGVKALSPASLAANTVVAKSTNPSSVLLDLRAGSECTDNLLQAEGTTVVLNSQFSALSSQLFNHNALYAESGNICRIEGSQLDFSGWKAVANAEGDIEEKASFISDDVFELSTPGNLKTGVYLSYLPGDIAGRERPKQGVTIGCAEYADASSVPTILPGYPKVLGSDGVSVKVACAVSCAAAIRLTAKPAGGDNSQLSALSSQLIQSGVPAIFTLDSLLPNKEYRVYAVATNAAGQAGEHAVSEPFRTPNARLEAATFEAIAAGTASDFTDGGYRFSGFKVEKRPGAPGVMPARNVATLTGESATVIPSAPGNIIDGMFIYSSAPVTLRATSPEGRDASLDIPATPWQYYSLRSLGPVSALTIEKRSGATLFIDDFAGTPDALSIACDTKTVEGEAGKEFTLTPAVKGGAAPLSFAWTSPDGVISQLSTLSSQLTRSGRYRFTVTDAHGNADTLYIKAKVRGDFVPADFEDVNLASESVWMGDTTLNSQLSTLNSQLYSGSFAFPNMYFRQFRSWAKFSASASSADYYLDLSDQLNSASGGGAQGSRSYGVAYVEPYYGATEMSLPDGEHLVPGLWLCNSAWVRDCIRFGDGMAYADTGFEQGDWLRLTITGIGADGSGTAEEIYLADFRADDPRDNYSLDTWQWIPLSRLGAVARLSLKIEGTKRNAFGLTTPAYVCLDGIGTDCPLAIADTLCITNPDSSRPGSFDLAPYFDFDPTVATVGYTLLRGADRLLLDGSTATFRSNAEQCFDIEVCAMQRGRRKYVRIPIRYNEHGGVPDTEYNNTIESVALYDIQGRKLPTTNLADLPSGIYIVREKTPAGMRTRKIVKK